jgi:DNA polymerase III delta prime subunit
MAGLLQDVSSCRNNMAENYQSLWVEKYRPKKIEDLVLEESVRADMLKYRESGQIPHLLFYGDAGGGKTTLALILVNEILDCQYMYINASDENGVDTVRGKIKDFSEKKSIDGKLKVIILDECDGFSSTGGGGSSAQQALRNVMEEYAHNVRFILTANYLHKLINPLISRCVAYKIEPPVNEFIRRCGAILKAEKIKIPDLGQFVEYVKKSYPDTRLAINCMQRDSLTGTLVIKQVNKTSQIVCDIIEYIQKENDPIGLRKLLIERATEFGSDYRGLMSNMFNAVYEADMSNDKKKAFMLELASGMYKHEQVMDKEVNCYASLLKLLK